MKFSLSNVNILEGDDAGGVVDISRWCKPPVTDKKWGEPRQGRRKVVARFPPPQPGLGLNLDDEPAAAG